MMSTEKQIHETAIRLLEGGREFYDGHWLRFAFAFDDSTPCFECSFDCICTDKMKELCMELDFISQKRCRLILVDGDKKQEDKI